MPLYYAPIFKRRGTRVKRNYECPICFARKGRFVVVSCHAGHVVHRQCMDDWVELREDDGLAVLCPCCNYSWKNDIEAEFTTIQHPYRECVDRYRQNLQNVARRLYACKLIISLGALGLIIAPFVANLLFPQYRAMPVSDEILKGYLLVSTGMTLSIVVVHGMTR